VRTAGQQEGEPARAGGDREHHAVLVEQDREALDVPAGRAGELTRESMDPLTEVRVAAEVLHRDAAMHAKSPGRVVGLLGEPRDERRVRVRVELHVGEPSRGSPSTRSPRMFRCTSLVPPPMVSARE
jgi:hypothetical protein